MYYAQFNAYGSESDTGFSNTWLLASFDTRAARDAWVEQHPTRADIKAVTQSEALALASRYQKKLYRRGGHLADVHFVTDDNVSFVRTW